MHFPPEQAVEVKAWMVKKLENISDADPEILSDYSIAILQSEDTDEEIRKSAVENLEDFLKEHTVKFVDEIFAKYARKPIKSTTASSKNSAVTTIGKDSRDGFPPPPYESTTFSNEKSSEKLNTGRKRSYQDAYGPGQDMQNGHGLASKSARYKRANKDARASGRGMSSQQLPPDVIVSSYPFTNLPPPPTPPPGFPAFDPTNPMAAFTFMQNLFPQVAGMLPQSPNHEQRTFSDKPRCQDYDTKGYCTLGSSCPFEHGNDMIIAPTDDEYDPTRANFSMNGVDGGVSRASSRTQRARRVLGGQGHFDSMRNGRAAFSDPRRPQDKNATTIVVEQIPEEYFDENTVRNYFSQYGKVLNVDMKPYKRLALVTYDAHGAAKRAWEDPKAIFENRFVKVYWYRPDLESTNKATARVSLPKEPNAATSTDIAHDEAFKQQQDEKQKIYEKRMRTKKAMDEARNDLVRRRENMAKERETLVAKLALAEGQEASQHSMNGSQHPQDDIASDSTDPKIKALRDQLARMQAEAKSLGIDPEAPPEDVPSAFGGLSRGFRGSMRRGSSVRGAHRGYGSPRGRHPGHGFVRGRDASVRKIDNRPKSIVMSGVEFDTKKEENLRSYLTLIGPFEDIELNPQRMDSRIIVFEERWQAEQVMHGKTDIPGVGKVELCWLPRTANGTMPLETSTYGAVQVQDVDEGARRTISDEAHRPQHDNLDVAGGDDDDDWGNIT